LGAEAAVDPRREGGPSLAELHPMDTLTPQPTKIGRFTIWVILALVAIVVVALALAFGRGGTGEGQPPEPVRDQGVNTYLSPSARA
jgi:hypothetical protein